MRTVLIVNNNNKVNSSKVTVCRDLLQRILKFRAKALSSEIEKCS